jgi:DNA polymerase-1
MNSHPVLIIDGLNAYIRAFSAYPQMTSNGEQAGGYIGFLKMLRRLVSECHPRAIYVCWEGGGSTKRRALYSEYKMNRKPEKLNRFYGDDIPESDENKKHQLMVLLSLLKCTPVCQLYVSDCEGDDVIAYLCRGPLRNEKKIIASSDKDLLQLLDDNTKIYSFHKKIYVTADDVLNEFRVTVSNFALAKALCGDVSDNIPGVKGLGYKKLVKLFPMLGTEADVLVQDIINFSASHRDEAKLYERVFEAEEIIKRNWRLVYLDGGMLAPSQASKVDHALSTFKPGIDRMSFTRRLIDEGIGDFDVAEFFYAFHCIANVEYK